MLRSLAMMLIVLVSFPLIFSMPHIGILVWTWISYLSPHRMMYGFASTFPFLNFIGVATAISWLVSRERKSIPAHPVLFVMLLFTGWFCLTTALSLNIETSYDKWLVTIKAVIYTIFMMGLINTRHRLNSLIYTICLCLGYFALKGGFFTIKSGGGSQVVGPWGTFIGDRNSLAMVLVMLLPLLRYVSLHAPSRWIRRLALVTMLFGAISVLGTSSRGGLLALAVAVLWMTLMSKRRFAVLASAILIGSFAFVAMPQSWKDRMATIQTYQQDGSAQGRLEMWRYSLNLAKDRPITGGGFFLFKMREVATEYLPPSVPLRASHSIFFEVLGEHGYVGLYLFLLFYATGFFSAGEARRLARGHPDLVWARDLSQMVQASLVSFLVGGAFLEVAFAEMFFHLCAIAAILHRVVATEVAGRPAPAGMRQPIGAERGPTGALSPAE